MAETKQQELELAVWGLGAEICKSPFDEKVIDILQLIAVILNERATPEEQTPQPPKCVAYKDGEHLFGSLSGYCECGYQHPSAKLAQSPAPTEEPHRPYSYHASSTLGGDCFRCGKPITYELINTECPGRTEAPATPPADYAHNELKSAQADLARARQRIAQLEAGIQEFFSSGISVIPTDCVKKTGDAINKLRALAAQPAAPTAQKE